MTEPSRRDDHSEKLTRTRRGLWRSALFWTPFFLAAAVGSVWFFVAQALGDGSGWVLPAVLLVLAILFGFQGGQAIRDLQGGTQALSGTITRHWSRSDMFVTRSHYVRIDRRQIVRVDKVQHQLVRQGDHVAIEYFPASMVAVSVERGEAPEATRPPAEARPADPLLIERD